MYESLYYTVLLILFSQNVLLSSAYTLTPSQSISDGQTLVSQGGKFEFGFFSPSPSSKNRYIGIWYRTISVQTVIWVANRESPVFDTSGVVKVDATGNIVIVNGSDRVIWSSNLTKNVQNPLVDFLESGNLVLRDAKDGNPDDHLWQSFDYPGDTLIPGMKLGWNLKTGLDRNLTSWKNSDDPSKGDFTYGLEIVGYPEFVMRKGLDRYYRGGTWNGIRNSGSPDLNPNSLFTYGVVQNADEIVFTYDVVNKSVIMRAVMVQSGAEGSLQRTIWDDGTKSWSRLLTVPIDRCDAYALCGVYGSCDMRNVGLCQCLRGFKPKSPKDWTATDWSQGCEREVPLNCSNGEGFRKYAEMKLPDASRSWGNTSMTLEECRVACLKNCSCKAYTNAYVTEGGSGCIMWSTDLIDLKQFISGGQDLYVRMPASELDDENRNPESNSKTKKPVTTIVIVTSIAGIILLVFTAWYVWKKFSKVGSEGDELELPLYNLNTITVATNNFSAENKLGEGGFGPVYKGILEGQEIAVKRLSKDSVQGVNAFKNEVILISKLQHKNLLKLIGCCIQGQEKMLVYEYMPNGSLNSSIFVESNRRLLDWQKRFQIIQGIARGLLYLHHDSRLKIIHRDLKASNILLDSEMVPKISDFGTARMFGGDQVDAKTKRVIGTYGYMSPEYVIDGHYSTKSDVFSFGVLVLEIISGKKNWGFHHPDHELNLLGHAWTLHGEGRSSEFVDKSMGDSCFDENVLRCIHIGLLCVQKETEKRPTMSSVLTMLSSVTFALPRPERPGFYMERNPIKSNLPYRDEYPYDSNEFTITLVDGR